ncbi:MAG: UbiX family flavin prenyltransferase [Candidatus Avilachnospira sp.]|jgi:4-hydroxy-3-polyprenylbenzoate decarboxylase
MKKIIVGVSGASGIPIAVALLKKLRDIPDIKTFLIMTRGAEITAETETGIEIDKIKALADVNYPIDMIWADIASGSFDADSMVVLPCSMKTLAGISCGYSENLLLRAADVMLKEKRPLILAVRETPLSSIHLRNMLSLAEMGAVILPPVMTYYHRPLSIEDMEEQIVGKILRYIGINDKDYKIWTGERNGF